MFRKTEVVGGVRMWVKKDNVEGLTFYKHPREPVLMASRGLNLYIGHNVRGWSSFDGIPTQYYLKLHVFSGPALGFPLTDKVTLNVEGLIAEHTRNIRSYACFGRWLPLVCNSPSFFREDSVFKPLEGLWSPNTYINVSNELLAILLRSKPSGSIILPEDDPKGLKPHYHANEVLLDLASRDDEWYRAIAAMTTAKLAVLRFTKNDGVDRFYYDFKITNWNKRQVADVLKAFHHLVGQESRPKSTAESGRVRLGPFCFMADGSVKDEVGSLCLPAEVLCDGLTLAGARLVGTAPGSYVVTQADGTRHSMRYDGGRWVGESASGIAPAAGGGAA